MPAAQKPLLPPESLVLLRKIAARVDRGISPEDSKTAANFLMRGIIEAGVTGEQLIKALEQFSTRGDYEKIVEELSEAIDTITKTLSEKENDLVIKTRLAAALEAENVRFKTMGGSEAELRRQIAQRDQTIEQLRTKGASAGAAPQNTTSSAFNTAAQQTAMAGIQAKLDESIHENEALKKGNRSLSDELNKERKLRAEITQQLDDTRVMAAKLVDQAATSLKTQIMSTPIAKPLPTNTGLLADIHAYVSNSQMGMNKIMKCREDVTAVLKLCAGALKLELETAHSTTNSFMKRISSNTNAYAELTTFKLMDYTGFNKRTRAEYALVINGSHYWFYKDPASHIISGALSTSQYYDVWERTSSSALNGTDLSDLYLWDSSSRNVMRATIKDEITELKPVTTRILQDLLKQSADIQAVAAVLRPLGYAI